MRAKLQEIEAVLRRRVVDGPKHVEPFVRPLDYPDDPGPQGAGYQLIGSAAVVPIHGTISPRPSVFAGYSGGTSAEQIGRAVDAAAADPKADAIVLDIDSPGGAVFGTPEAGAKILAARKVKPVHAVANHMAASGAYWLATQATTLSVTPAGWVGSVGVIWPRLDDTKADEQAGLVWHYITAGEFKADGAGPMTAEESARRQVIVDEYYRLFGGAVATGRGVPAAKVEKDFGQGDVKLPADAIASRMADRVATLEQVLNEVNGVRTERTKRKVAADLAAKGLPTTVGSPVDMKPYSGITVATNNPPTA